MYVEIDFNLLYQLERIAKNEGRSVTEIVNEAVAEYPDRYPPSDESAAPDDA